MPFIPDQHPWVQKLRAALTAAETGPSKADLAEAPVLDLWRPLVSPHGAPILWGLASGHPRLGNTWVTTSQLVAIGPAKGWARTASRWYALARPFTDYEAEVARSLGMKNAPPGFLQLDMPGFQPLEDERLLGRLLTAWAERIRRCEGEGG